MKKYCKDIDVTDFDFIYKSILDCIDGKYEPKASKKRTKKRKWSRKDVFNLLCKYEEKEKVREAIQSKKYSDLDRAIKMIAADIQKEIINQEYKFVPTQYREKIDGSSGKIRKICIQNIKNQLYDYIIVNGLREMLDKRIGYYQCSAIPGKGQEFGTRALSRWIKDKRMRIAWKADIRHYFQTISHEKMKNILEKHVSNPKLLHLAFAMIDEYEDGLAIGSYLSQYLANLYAAEIYHFIAEDLYKIRKKKGGTAERVNLVKHQLFYMDDILIIGTSEKDITMAAKRIEKKINELGLELKKDSCFIDLRTKYADMMGYKVSRRNVTIRPKTYRRIRKCARRINRMEREGIAIPPQLASRILSLKGKLAYSDSRHVIKKHRIENAISAAKRALKEGRKKI